jgi:hypothetical protein
MGLIVCAAAFVGGRAVFLGARYVSAVAAGSAAVKTVAPIPQDAAAIAKRRHDWLAWNQRTLGDAYDRVGKQDPRWDEAARKTFSLAARMFSREVDPEITFSDVFTAARAAVDAGCDDAMLLYLYGRSSVGPDDPGNEEAIRRARAAARALESSRYPALRRAVALKFSASRALSGGDPGGESRKAVERALDAALALLGESAAGDERCEFWELTWTDTLIELTRGYRTLGVPAETAYERVDAALARVADAKLIRLLYRGDFWLHHGWQARTNAFAPAVSAGGWEAFGTRLDIARQAFEDAWKLRPGLGPAARNLLEIDKGAGGDRATMELWFDRAMKADGDDRDACWSKLDWLDPKWHGSAQEMLAFGRACRDTKNWRTGITLLVGDAHFRIAAMHDGDGQLKYMARPDVWADIQPVYDEYLKHHPHDDVARSKYATFCYLGGHFREAQHQYVALGDRLTQWREFPFVPLEQLKKNRDHTAQLVMGNPSPIGIPGWHFVGGKNEDGQWRINIPLGAERKEEPGILGAEVRHVWNCSANGVEYRIRVQQVPPAARSEGAAHVLDEARAKVALELNGQPRDVHDAELANHPAQEYIVDAPDLRPRLVRVRTALIGTWLYEFAVTATKADLAGKSANEFLDSFTFRKQATASRDADPH